MTQERFDIHQHITDQIVTLIERGAGEFRLPWQCRGTMTQPANVVSKKHYRGVNIVALWAASLNNGYTSGLWGTYRQWAQAGAQVRKGEKASYVVFYKEIEIAGINDAGDDETEKRLMAKASAVFSQEQVDGYVASASAEDSVIEPIQAADNLVKSTGAVIRYGGSSAYYRPSTNSIQMPEPSSFIGSPTSTPQEAFYSTLLHELTHWTSHPTRCDRQLGKRFGDDAYAMEELIAELGAAFLCADLGVT